MVAAKGDFVLSVKDNQPKLPAALQERFERRHAAGRRGRRQHQATRDKGHGRQEERHYYHTPIPPELDWIAREWPAESLGQVISYVTRDGQQTTGFATTSAAYRPMLSVWPTPSAATGASKTHSTGSWT